MQNNHLSKSSLVLISLAIVTSGLVVSGSLIYTNQLNIQNDAIQGCYENASGVSTTSGKSGDSGWQVNAPTIDQNIFEQCVKQKGY